MFTIQYKGWFIHGNFDRDEVKIQSPNKQIRTVKTMRAAKQSITRNS